MIPPGECTYAGRKRRKPLQKQRPALGADKSNPSKRHRDRLNAELDHLASLLPFPPDIISKLDKLSVLRLSVSYLRVKSFFQVVQEKCSAAGGPALGGRPRGGSAVLEGRLLLESLNGFALVVSAEGMIFYASATIVDYLGFHQTDVMHQNIYDYIHVDDRQDFSRQLHWAMDPPRAVCGQPPHADTGEDAILRRLLGAQEGAVDAPAEYAAFLTRCFVCRMRCLLDSTSGFLTMQFQGKLKFLFGQKKKAPSGTALPPRLSLFCVAAPVLLPPAAEVKVKSSCLRVKHRADAGDAKVKVTASLCEPELHGKPDYFAGRSHGENSVLVFRTQTEAGRWARVPASTPCLCLGGAPSLVLHPRAPAGDREEGQEARPCGSSAARGPREIRTHHGRCEPMGPTRRLDWAAGRHGEGGGLRSRLPASKSDLFSLRPAPRGSCPPYPGARGMVGAGGMATFRSAPVPPSPGQPLGACSSRVSRPWRDVQGGQEQPLPGLYPPGSLENRPPQPGAQRFPEGGYPTEAPRLQMPPGGPCDLALPLGMPIKTEKDSGSEDAADGYTPSQAWLGAGDMAKRHLATFPTRMHLKTEPESRYQVYTPHLGHCRAPARPSGELVPFCPAHCGCRGHTHALPLQGPPRPLCVHQPPVPPGCSCRAAGAAPVVKCEPLDSPPWAAHSQGAVPGMFPKSALVPPVPPRAPECTFLP
ncbi:aryl hydrocarbon receptor repressor [Microcebus murinus]|uniref:aryl hydrocarbon receptor repressor n=1 Tax=Microcebus murinus TaxID=30608 RepID=UPI000643DF2C